MEGYTVAMTAAYAVDPAVAGTVAEPVVTVSADSPLGPWLNVSGTFAPADTTSVTQSPEPDLEGRLTAVPELGDVSATEAPVDAYATTSSIDYWVAYLAQPGSKGDDGKPVYPEYGDLGMVIDRVPGRTNGLFGSTYPGGEPGKMFKINAGEKEMERQFLPRIRLYVEEIGDHLYATQRIAPHEGSHNRSRDFSFVNAEGAALHEQYTRARTSTAQPGVGFYTA